MRLQRRRSWPVLLVLALLSSCATSPPSNTADICAIFADKRGWQRAADKSAQRWGTPVHIQMAIIKQESNFRHDARPPRNKLFGLIPTTHRSSSYGYAQAKDETWDRYRSDTGNRSADRDNFADAIDFVGWYTAQSQKLAGISKWDPYGQYLAYHEGQTGYQRGSYRNKQWLMDVASKVDRVAREWGARLRSC